MTATYITTLDVFNYMRWNKKIPAFVSGSTPSKEVVDETGTLTANSIVYLDFNKIIDNTLNLYYGTSGTASVVLTEGTHYTVDLDNAKITITSSGATLIGSNSVFAEYQYNDFVEDSLVADMVERAQEQIEEECNRRFGTPTLIEREEQTGRGAYDRIYRPKKLPVVVAKTQLTSDITTATTVVLVDDTSGFEVGDILTLNQETLQINAIPSGTSFEVTRGHFGTADIASHSEDDWMINVVVEISNTEMGSTPNWSTLDYRDDFDVDSNTGAIQLLHINANERDDLSQDVFPVFKVFNRVRITYKYGATSVPKDIQKAIILTVARDLIDSALTKSIPEGIDGFAPEAIDKIDAQIKKLLNGKKLLLTDAF